MSTTYQFGKKKRENGVDSFSAASIAESLHKSHAETSAYSRIFRKSNVYASSMPEFLREQAPSKGITADDLRRLNIQAIPSYSLYSSNINPLTLQIKVQTILETMKPFYHQKRDITQQELSSMEALVNAVLSNADPELSVTVKKWHISGDELNKLVNNRDISAKIVNVYMQHLKQINKIRLKMGATPVKFNFVSVEFAEAVLIRGMMTKVPNFIASYDVHVFPLFNHFWKMVVFYKRLSVIKVYDLGRNYGDAEMFAENLKEFCRINEMQVDKIEIDLPQQKEIRFWNSGLFICSIASKIVMQENPVAEGLSDFRLEMLIILLKLSQMNLVKPVN
jgi:hypothetical protein